jgi:hypothetical protein
MEIARAKKKKRRSRREKSLKKMDTRLQVSSVRARAADGGDSWGFQLAGCCQ